MQGGYAPPLTQPEYTTSIYRDTVNTRPNILGMNRNSSRFGRLSFTLRPCGSFSVLVLIPTRLGFYGEPNQCRILITLFRFVPILVLYPKIQHVSSSPYANAPKLRHFLAPALHAMRVVAVSRCRLDPCVMNTSSISQAKEK